MGNYTEENIKLLPIKPTFWLHFHMNGAGCEFMDHQLPMPNYLEHTNAGYDIAWQIDGYFSTPNGIAYVNDIIGRVLVTFNEEKPRRLPWKPDVKTADHYYPKIYRLRDLQNLKSKTNRQYAPKRADSYDDHAFWAIKLHTEDLIRDYGEGVPIPFSELEEWSLVQFEHKERSTIRAKCRSVWNWYDCREWQLPKQYIKKDPKEVQMTRLAHIEKVNQNRKLSTRDKIEKVVNDLFLHDEIRTKSGKLNASAIAKKCDLARLTVAKHLKEMGLS